MNKLVLYMLVTNIIINFHLFEELQFKKYYSPWILPNSLALSTYLLFKLHKEWHSHRHWLHCVNSAALANRCHFLRYLQLLVSHSLFGLDRTLDRFLLDKEPPPRSKIEMGLLTKFTSSMDVSRKMVHKVCCKHTQRKSIK